MFLILYPPNISGLRTELLDWELYRGIVCEIEDMASASGVCCAVLYCMIHLGSLNIISISVKGEANLKRTKTYLYLLHDYIWELFFVTTILRWAMISQFKKWKTFKFGNFDFSLLWYYNYISSSHQIVSKLEKYQRGYFTKKCTVKCFHTNFFCNKISFHTKLYSFKIPLLPLRVY